MLGKMLSREAKFMSLEGTMVVIKQEEYYSYVSLEFSFDKLPVLFILLALGLSYPLDPK